MKSKKSIEIIPETKAPVVEDDMERLNNKHYEKQMDMVRYIHNLKKKGLDLGNTSIKAQLAPSYIEMVWGEGLEKMDEYWRKMHKIKKEYKGVVNES